MPKVRIGPITGLVMQLALLTRLELTTAGWIAGVVHGLCLCAILSRGMPTVEFGPANWITLTRACLAGGITAMVAESFTHQISIPLLIGLCVVALMLDAVDGYVARRTNTATPFGARFDMETDAFLILVLSVYVARDLGMWVLAIGLMRYAYVVAMWLIPWLDGPLPPRYWRKVVAAVQGIVLAAAASGLFPRPLTTVAVLGALALLIESFGRDVWWRRSHGEILEMKFESV